MSETNEGVVEKVTTILKEVKKLEEKIKSLKDLNRSDKDAVIKYMLDNKKQYLGGVELKLYKGTYYLSLVDNSLFG